MEALPPDLEPARLRDRLRTARLGHSYEPHAVCPSTNDLAAARARAGAPEGLVVVADTQTGGRGRMGRSWHSPPGENLYLSLLLRPARAPLELPPLTLLAGVAVAAALQSRGVSPRVKWPNDILLDRPEGPRKLVGVLTEMATERDRIKHVIVGIGVNVNAAGFPPELADRATSLRMATGQVHDRGALLAEILERLETAYDGALREGAGTFLPTWRALAGLPRPARVERAGGALEGVAVGVDNEGALLLRDGRGESHRVVSGEIVEAPAGG
jgi:BirA family biotin operon repressor/biotin-[acetyl-CoA-carboxylase] ligase